MTDSGHSASPSRTGPLILGALLVITWIGVSLATSTTGRLTPPATSSQSLTVDEAAYYEFVAPRLERLVEETDSVIELVKTRSRNVISLTVHGNRITTLAAEIRAFGLDNPVPDRFEAIHEQILDGTEHATTAIADARSALQRFDFSEIPSLIPQFEDGSSLLHQALDALTVIANSTPQAEISG